ncbi:TetR/AcrR family transcriptional regulator [Mycolicibacterium helvum]|uniref:TetR/AcrR family transcriptional regulator n=1 Tax=Mycolicibacterium helvum TaxID=1534349 RepID=UPI0013D3F288|nr:TetR/AcrR family transcriptional regulator [Mycolicibacterium helvum]
MDRDAIVDAALELFVSRGYQATTFGDIALASGVESDLLAAAFPDHVCFIFAVADAMFAAVFEELAKAPQAEDLVEVLRAAHLSVVGRIVAGEGPVPLMRMYLMGRVLATNTAVAQAVSVHRKRVLTCGMADQRGVGHDDPQIVRAVMVWSAIMACTHAAGIHDGVAPDHFATDLTERRLDRNCNLVRRGWP